MDLGTFLSQTTIHVRDLLQPDFMLTGNTASAPFWQILDQAQAYRWRCQTPLRMYYGEADDIIPLYLSTLPAAYQNQLGSNTIAISAGAIADHRAGYVYSLIHAKPWFNEFLKK